MIFWKRTVHLDKRLSCWPRLTGAVVLCWTRFDHPHSIQRALLWVYGASHLTCKLSRCCPSLPPKTNMLKHENWSCSCRFHRSSSHISIPALRYACIQSWVTFIVMCCAYFFGHVHVSRLFKTGYCLRRHPTPFHSQRWFAQKKTVYFSPGSPPKKTKDSKAPPRERQKHLSLERLASLQQTLGRTFSDMIQDLWSNDLEVQMGNQ